MVAFSALALVPDDVTEGFGNFYMPHRGRQTCRGADGRFYSGYTGVNGAGTAGIVRVVAWSVDAVGTLTTHWDLKVSDISPGHGLPDGSPPASFALAIDNNGSAERLLVLIADNKTTDTMRFFYTTTAGTPSSFTAGDTFTLKEPVYTVSIGIELFGRNGSGVITCIYGNADDADVGTTLSVIKVRTLSTHSGSWSAASDAMGGVLPYAHDVFFAGARDSTGATMGCLYSHGPGALTSGLFFSNASSPFSSWSASKSQLTQTNAIYHVLSMAADASGNWHAVFLEKLNGTQSLRYAKFTSATTIAENTVLHAVTFTDVLSLPSTWSYLFYRTASITVDQDGNPHVVAGLRSTPTGFTATPLPGKTIEGQSVYYRKVSGAWQQYVVTNRKAQADPPSGNVLTVNSQSMPHDACVVGKMGYPAAGALWLEVACHNQLIGGTGIPSCASPGVQRRIVFSDDFEPGMTRRGRNTMGSSQGHTLAGPKPVFSINVLAFGQSATHPGSTFPRTGANAMTINGSASGGKGKNAANACVLTQLATVIVDFLSKWTGRNVLDFTQAATLNGVWSRSAGNALVLLDGFGKAFQTSDAIEFTQLAVASGSLRVFAGNALDFTQGAVHDPIEGCETNYQTAVDIPDDPDSHIFVSITAPALAPAKTIVLRRPDLDDITDRVLQGEVSRSQDGQLRSAIRSPNPIEWTVQFSGLTRKQVIELEDFFVEWRGKSMIYRDHNNWRWLVWLLTDKPMFQSVGSENWSVSLAFSGTLIV